MLSEARGGRLPGSARSCGQAGSWYRGMIRSWLCHPCARAEEKGTRARFREAGGGMPVGRGEVGVPDVWSRCGALGSGS